MDISQHKHDANTNNNNSVTTIGDFPILKTVIVPRDLLLNLILYFSVLMIDLQYLRSDHHCSLFYKNI